MNRWIIVFAREPQQGRVKTRLEKALSRDQCAALYRAFLKDTLDTARTIKHPTKVLAYDAGKTAPRFLKKSAPDFVLYEQAGRNLGEKISNAFARAAAAASSKTVIIGTDAPNLPAIYIREAFRRLDEADVVLGPCEDGGYYLIGLNEPCPGLFTGIEWGSGTVFRDTLANARSLHKEVYLLKTWYDVDDPAGLDRLRRDLRNERESASWTRKFLKIS